MVSRMRETEEIEKGEGSLSIFIILTEIWGINPRRPRPGKGDVWNRDCNFETLNESESLK
jgi:hypothetical protein